MPRATRPLRLLRRFGLIAALAAAPLAARAEAVLVELFTSQGCAACPPADAFLHDLAARPDVVALALHVDYWDYLGWRDVFAQPVFSARQMAYRDAAGRRSVFTPEMIVQGVARHGGAKRDKVLAAIAAAAGRPAAARLALEAEGLRVRVRVTPAEAMAGVREGVRAEARARGGAVVWAVLYRRAPAPVAIAHGENHGRESRHVNVALDWRRRGEWDGRAEARFETAGPAPEEGLAVIVQQGPVGPVLATAKYEP